MQYPIEIVLVSGPYCLQCAQPSENILVIGGNTSLILVQDKDDCFLDIVNASSHMGILNFEKS